MFAMSHFDVPRAERHHPSHDRFTDTRHATIDATQYYRSTDSLVHCRPLDVEGSGDPSAQPTRSEEIHVRAVMLSRLEGTIRWSIALVELRHDEVVLAVRWMADHNTKHSHIGT